MKQRVVEFVERRKYITQRMSRGGGGGGSGGERGEGITCT